MAVDSTKLKLIERTSDGKIREIALNQINNLKAVSGAQYTLVDTVTNNAPANMLVKRVGNSLVVDIAGETGVLEIGDFYAQNATAFSTSGTLPAAGASTAGSSALITAETGAIGATVVGEPIVYAASSSLLAGATTGLGLGTIAAIGGGAAVAGAALGGGGGGGSAPATPTVSLKHDTGSSASDFITNDAQLDVSAPAAGVTRTYRVDGGPASETYTPPTTPGPHAVVVIDTNSAGSSTSATLTFTLKTSVATPTVVLAHDSGRSDSDNVTNDAHLNVSEAAAGVTRTYTVDGGEASASYTAPTTAGEHTVVVTDTDVAGNTSTQTLTFTLETAVPTPVVGLASDTGTSGSDKITHDASLSVSDKAADVVRTYSVDGGEASETYTAPSDHGHHYVVVTDTDAAGNTASTTINFTLVPTVSAPSVSLAHDTGSSNSDDLTNDACLDISAAAAGITRTYAVDGGEDSASYVAPTVNGHHSVVVTDTAADGSSASTTLEFDLDKTAPAAATAEVAGNLTGDETPVITVHAEAGAAVAVEVNGQSYAAVETTNAGEYLVTVADVLADGIYAPTITVTDLAGNQTVATGTPFVVDTGAPVLGLQLHADSGTSDNDGLTNEHLVEVTGLETNVSWRYSTDGGEDWTTVAGDQPHSFVLPADGDYAGKVLVEQTDPAGNVGSATLADTVLDTVAPLPPAFALADDTGLSHKDSVSNNGVMNVSGLEGGAHWEYSLDSGNTWITGEDSSFTLAEGLYAAGTVQVRQYDDAGNYSPVVILGSDVEIDQTNPGDLTFNRLVTNNTIDYPAGVMTGALGKGAAADSVQIVIEGTTYTHGDGHLTIADGEWTLNLAGTTLGEGHYDATWVESDLAGNLVSGTMADALWIANDNVFALASTIADQHWGEPGTVDFGAYVTALGGLELTGDGTVLFDGSPSSSLGEVMIGGVGGEDLGVQLTDGALDISAGDLWFNGVGITAVSGLAGVTADGDLSASAHVSVDAAYLGLLVTDNQVGGEDHVAPIEVLENDTTVGGSLTLSDAGVDLNADYIFVATEASPFEVQQTLGGESTILVSQQHLRAGFGGEDSVGDVLIDNAHIELSAGMIGMLSINQLYQEQGTYSASEVLTGVFPFMGVSDHTSWTTVSAADSTMAEFVGTDVVITQHDVVAQQGHVDAHDAHIGLSAWGPIFAGDVGIAQTSLAGASVDVSGAAIDLESAGLPVFGPMDGIFLVDRYATNDDTSVYDGTMGSAVIGQVGLYAYDGDLQADGVEIQVAAPVVMLKDAAVYQAWDFAAGDVTLSGAGVHVTADYFMASSQPGLDGFYQSAADGHVAVVQYGISAGGTIDAQDAHVDVHGYSDVTAGGFYVEQGLMFAGIPYGGGDVILDGASVHVAGEDISISDSAAVRQFGMYASLGSVEANNVVVSVQGDQVTLGNPGYDGGFDFFPNSLSGLELAGSAKVVETSFWGEDAVHATAASVDVDLTDGGFYAAAVVQAGFFAGNAIDVGSAEVQVHEAAGGNVSAQAIYVAQVGMFAGDVDGRDVGVHVNLGEDAALDIVGEADTTFIGGGIGIAQAGVSAWSADADFSNAHIEVSAGEDAHLGFYAVPKTVTTTSDSTHQIETHGYGTHSEVVIAIDQTDIMAVGAVTLTDASLDVTLGDGAGLTVDGGSIFVKQDDIYAFTQDVLIDHASVHVAGGADSEILLNPQHWYTVNVTGYQSSYDVTITDTDRWVTYDTYVDGTFITSTTSHDYQTHTTPDSSFMQTASETVGLYDLYGDAYISQFDVTAFTGNLHAHDASVGLTVGDDGRIEAHDVFVSQRNLSAGGEIDATLASAIVQIGANATATLADVYVDQEWFTAGGDISVAAATAAVQVGTGGDVTMSDPYVSQHDLHAGGNIDASGVLAYVSAGDEVDVYFTGTLDSVLVDQERFTAGGNIDASDLLASVTLGDNATLNGDWVDVYQNSFSAGGAIDATALSALLDFGVTADVSLEGLSVEQYNFTAGGDIDVTGALASVSAGQGSNLLFGEDVGVDQENFTASGDISVGSAMASVSLGDEASLSADWIYAYQSDLTAGGDIDATAVEVQLDIGTLGDVTLTGLDVEQRDFSAYDDIDASGALASVTAGQGSDLTFDANVYVEQATFSADSISVDGATVAVTLGDNAELHGQWIDVYQTLFSADDGDIDATAVSALLDFGASADVTLTGLYVEQRDFSAYDDIDASGALASVTAGQGSDLTFDGNVYVEQATFSADSISVSGATVAVTLGDNAELHGQWIDVYQSLFSADYGDIDATAVSALLDFGATADVTLDEGLNVGQYQFTAAGDIDATGALASLTAGQGSTLFLGEDVGVDQVNFTASYDISVGSAVAMVTLGDEAGLSADSIYALQASLSAGGDIDATAVSALLDLGTAADVTLTDVHVGQYSFTAGDAIDVSSVLVQVAADDGSVITLSENVYLNQVVFSADSISAGAVAAAVSLGDDVSLQAHYIGVNQTQFKAADGDIAATGVLVGITAGDRADITLGDNNVHLQQIDFAADGISVADAAAIVSLGDDANLFAGYIDVYQAVLSASDGDIGATAISAQLELGADADVTLTGVKVNQNGFTASGDIDATGVLARITGDDGADITLSQNVRVEQFVFTAGSISVGDAAAIVSLGDEASLLGSAIDVYQNQFLAGAGNIDATAVSAQLELGTSADVTLSSVYVGQYVFTANGEIDASDVLASVTLGSDSVLTLDELFVSQYDFDAGGTGFDILATAVGVEIELGDWADATMTSGVYVAQGHFHDASTIDIGLAHATLSLGEESDITLDSVYVSQYDMTALDEVLATAVSAEIWTDHPSVVHFMAGEDEVVLGVYQDHFEAGTAETRPLSPTTYFGSAAADYVTAFTGTVDLSEAAVVLSACTVSGTDQALIGIQQGNLAAGLLVDLSDASVSVDVDVMDGTLDAIGIFQHDITVGGRVYEWGEFIHNSTPFDAVTASYLTGSVDLSHNVVDVDELYEFDATAVGITRVDVTAGLSIDASHNEVSLYADDDVTLSVFDYLLAEFDARTIDASYNTLHLEAGEGDAEVDEVMLGVMDAASKFLTVNHNLIEVEAWDDDDGEVTANYVGVDVDSRLQSGSSSNHVDVSDNRIRIVADEDVTIGYVGYDVTVASATLHADHNEIYVSAGDDVTIGELHNIDVTAASLLTGSSVEHNDVFVTADDNIWVTHFDQAGTDAHATFWGNSVWIGSLEQASAASEHVSIYAESVDVTLHSSVNHIDVINVQQQDVERLDPNVIDWWQANVTLEAATASTVYVDNIAVDYAQAFLHFDMGVTSGSYLFDITASDVGVAVNNQNSTWGSSDPVHDANLQYDLIDLHDLGITSTTQLTLGSWSIDDRLGEASSTEHIFDELQFYGTAGGTTVRFTLDDLRLDSGLLADMDGSGPGTQDFWSVAAGQDQANAVWTMVEHYVLHLGSGGVPV